MVAFDPQSSVQSQPQQTILCCQCGVPIPPNPAAMCVACISHTVDITEGIPKQSTVHFCKNCERYLQPPNVWVAADLESRELLALLVKRLRGLSKVRLVDAGFIWTEPHSKRLKIKLTIQKEVFANTILQQVFIVEYVVAGQQCEACARVMAENSWRASVQVRQKVPHKRTFLYLEQLILKHNMQKDTINIKETREGLDFFFAQRSHAIRFAEFLNAVVPTRSKWSEQLISTDIHTSTANSRYSYSVELVPICKDDLIVLPPKLAKSMGGMGQLVLCTRVANTLTVMDPNSLQAHEISAAQFWRTPFNALGNARHLTEYYVIDVEPSGLVRGKYALADVQVGRCSDDSVFWARTHLGNVLHVGDAVMGYDLTNVNFNSDDWDELVRAGRNGTPDVVLVRKAYPARRRVQKARAWKLKSLNKAAESDLEPKKGQQDKADADYEQFLRDLEEDPELRAAVDLYKDPEYEAKQLALAQQAASAGDMDMDEDVEEDFPEIDLGELLEDMTLDDKDGDEYVE
ncbi:RNA binding protein [Catenaria anguillulae PL171]|uniref:60S ribosomal export protein NMD3 n=1 Tax=Catenaria anguillulae PL171 TaxID=765915 RepID=A0A1Y2I064_9FUNG|nr:RNA binding protein [Catenaria anguillulae PL171]